MFRTWEEQVIDHYFEMNQDLKVLQHLPGPLALAEVGQFIFGFTGLHTVEWPAPFTPAVEIGWRLASMYWGQGLATEAARASLAYGFSHCQLDEIVSIFVQLESWRN